MSFLRLIEITSSSPTDFSVDDELYESKIIIFKKILTIITELEKKLDENYKRVEP